MSPTFWFVGLFALGLLTLGLMVAFVSFCDGV